MSTEQEDIIYNAPRGAGFQKLINGILKRAGLSDTRRSDMMSPKWMIMWGQVFTDATANDDLNYEIFENMGDSTAGHFIVKYMYRRFPQLLCPGGVKVVARLKINYGARQSFSDIADRLQFWDYISASEDKRSRKKKDLLEDVFESVIGLMEYIGDIIYKDGVGNVIAYGFLKSLFDEIPISLSYTELYDAKTRLKELYDFYKKTSPIGLLKYNNVRDINTGIFKVSMTNTVGGREVVIGSGASTKLKDAEQKAAKMGLVSLAHMGLTKQVPQEYAKFNSL